LRDMYEKRISDLKAAHGEELRKMREDYER
jgi:hypothetical protein